MERLYDYILNEWEIEPIKVIEKINIGFFNLIHRVKTSSNTYYLRVFQSDCNLHRIESELWITNYLSNNFNFSFLIPCALPNKGDGYISRFMEGDHIACLVSEIPGVHPDMESEEDMFQSGRALGMFNRELYKVQFGQLMTHSPSYSDLGTFHPSVTDFKECLDNLLISELEKIAIENVYNEVTSTIQLHYNQLPKQYIHGDYTNGNRLIHNGRISGILDFEFFCWDVRVMDLAIGLGGGPTTMWEHDSALNTLKAFTEGYLKENSLERIEILAIPSLVRLRRMAMFNYFLGRFIDGHETQQSMRGILQWLLTAEEWIKENNDLLLSALLEKWNECKDTQFYKR